MPDDDARLAEVQDPDGREVVSLARVWEGKITRDHPELPGRLDEVLDAVTGPDHIEPDPLVGRLRYDRRRAERWLLALVSFEQQPGRVITAIATRKDPKSWKP